MSNCFFYFLFHITELRTNGMGRNSLACRIRIWIFYLDLLKLSRGRSSSLPSFYAREMSQTSIPRLFWNTHTHIHTHTKLVFSLLLTWIRTASRFRFVDRHVTTAKWSILTPSIGLLPRNTYTTRTRTLYKRFL